MYMKLWIDLNSWKSRNKTSSYNDFLTFAIAQTYFFHEKVLFSISCKRLVKVFPII